LHAKNYRNFFEITVISVMGIIVSMITNGIVDGMDDPVLAQTNTIVNMTGHTMDSARFHLRVADELLTRSDTKAAADQVNLAGIQLSLLNMGSEVATINQTQAMEFVVGGSLSSMKMAANCIIDYQAMVRCM
jgi:ribulose 1,5-bisphosphate synthetase/thiazole synthase